MAQAVASWDCHAHAFGPAAQFPPAAERGYDPPPVRPEAHAAEAQAAGIGHIVWVQPSVYGADNAAALATLAARGGRDRAVIAPPATADPVALHRLKALGVRGLRLNLVSRGGNGPESLAPFRSVLPELGWHVAAFLDGTDPAALDAALGAAEVPVVLDHFGWPGGRPLPEPAAFAPMLRRLEAGWLWVKLSAPYQICAGAAGCPRAAALARAILTANPNRVLFGSNWPHVMQAQAPALGDLVAATAGWCTAVRLAPDRLFSRNPAILYD